MFPGMRATANSDQSFWSRPADAEAGWMDDLSTEPVDTVDAAETHALDEFAAGRHTPTDRVFHELRDVVAPAPVGDGLGVTDGTDDPDDPLPPAASAAFDINAVSDDLLPNWKLDLG
jgi:hypothetical protein